ncbi:MAG: hypothetical protein IJY42_03370 [Clostridia bacterium]|nr:hypothetical protein [Clostridia bacterium]
MMKKEYISAMLEMTTLEAQDVLTFSINLEDEGSVLSWKTDGKVVR